MCLARPGRRIGGRSTPIRQGKYDGTRCLFRHDTSEMTSIDRPAMNEGGTDPGISQVIDNVPGGQTRLVAQSASAEQELNDIKSAVIAKLVLAVGKDAGSATDRDWFVASAFAIRDRIIHRWLATERASNASGSKRVYYLSLEFLIGRLLSDVLCNLGLSSVYNAALGDLGVDVNGLRSAEPDAALG